MAEPQGENPLAIEYFEKGVILTRKKEFETARKLYDMALTLTPLSLSLKGAIYANLAGISEDTDEAIKLEYKAIELYPGAIMPYRCLHGLLNKQKRYSERLSVYYLMFKNLPLIWQELNNISDAQLFRHSQGK